MMKKIKIYFTGLMFAITTGAFAVAYDLVKDGKPAAGIVLPDNAGPVEKHAASELSLFLEKVTGVKVNMENAPSKELYNIYLGTTEAKSIPRSEAIDKAVSQLQDDGFVLAADKDGIRVISKKPVGVLYGAYEILKKYAGIRWLAPGAEYEYCPRRASISVPEQVTVSNPSFKFRRIEMAACNWNSNLTNTWDWMVRNGLTVTANKWLLAVPETGKYHYLRVELEKRGAESSDGGHAFSSLLSDDLFDTHPEYFPLIDGKRRKLQGDKGWPQPCTSNPKVAEIMAESLNKWLDTVPPGGRYLIGNNDDNKWCQCENCVKLDPPDEKEKHFVGTRYFTLLNQIVAEVSKLHPRADLCGWAYQNFQSPPTGVVPDKRLTISVCVHGRCYRHSMADTNCLANAMFRDILPGWARFGNQIVSREYNTELTGECHSYTVPSYIPVERVFCQDLKYYHQLGLAGFNLIAAPPDGIYRKLYTRHVPEYWYAMWPLFYLAAQVAWDVNADYDRLADDMGAAYYGPAWPVMKQYRAALVRMFADTPGHLCYPAICYGNFILGKCLDKPGIESELLRLLDEGQARAANDPIVLPRIKRDREYFSLCWQALHKEWLAKRQKELNVRKRTDEIVIDGKFDEADWKKTDFTNNFIVTDGKAAADPQTFVKTLYDEDNIYLAVEAMEPQPDKMKIKIKERDGALWEDSSLELFITAPGMNDKYAQIAINPNGVISDSLVAPGSEDADVKFDAGIEVKTKTLSDRWVAEIRIPAAAFGGKIQDGEAWKVNVARNRRLVDGQSQSSSWSGGIFHGSDAWRSLIMGDTALLKNGDFEDAVEPSADQRKSGWKFLSATIPVYWTFQHNTGRAELITNGAASGRQFLRLQDGRIYQPVKQTADCRDNLRIRAKVRGKGTFSMAMYLYDRNSDKNHPSIQLKETAAASSEWTLVEADYPCADDKKLILALVAKGEIDMDDVSVTREHNRDRSAQP